MLAVEKVITSKLLKAGANKRIATIDRHMGAVCTIPILGWSFWNDKMANDPSIGIFRISTRR